MTAQVGGRRFGPPFSRENGGRHFRAKCENFVQISHGINLILDRPDFAMMLVILKFQNLKLSHDVIDLTCPKPNVSKMFHG